MSRSNISLDSGFHFDEVDPTTAKPVDKKLTDYWRLIPPLLLFCLRKPR